MVVSVERYVEEVQRGSMYKGCVKIAGTDFKYEFAFRVPISELDKAEQCKDVAEIRSRYSILVRQGNGVYIVMSDEEFGIFFSILVEFVVGFYNQPQFQEMRQGLRDLGLSPTRLAASLGAEVSVGMMSSGSYEFPPESCRLLSASKFGCKFKV